MALASVPKAAVDEYGYTRTAKHEVRLAAEVGQHASVHSIAQAARVERAPEK
jgi:hypothetical protein